ncbi:signal recognition particle protein [Capsulimonas corticalis]|uniref:Signal recognition particle protein n=1 Tax=Capsulimonas corticalis TaxID=2219043 RepID=A0A402CX62_9BACT|nr:signal recognition particle protein [Capsulimonas corticalis]BDI32403.1 signal recognition particle protein [Capsulimonas corticalis]
MFESLTDKLQGVFKRLRGKSSLSEQDVNDAMREVRLVLLEADVNFKVVKDFTARVRERAVGEQILEGLNAPQQVVKIVSEELTALLGGEQAPLTFSHQSPTVIMLCGLQGAGKTTHAGKLAAMLRKQGRNPMLVAGDIYRPAAIKQLEVVGEQVKTPVFTMGDQTDPAEIAKAAVDKAQRYGNDVVIVDTAGRLQIDEALMDELRRVKAAVRPHEILLVVDAMTGQEAVNVAKGFNDALEIDGVILTKLDGDARGGAALSVKTVVGKPIKFVGVGEKMDALEIFYPDRMVSRILGMGDVMTLIERAEAAIDQKQAAEFEKKLRANKFDFEDYLEQMQQVRKLGPLDQILDMIPGLSGKVPKMPGASEESEKQMKRVEAIICSMTVQERREPTIINGSRRRRIAAGSGASIQDVNRVLTQFEQMKTMMRGFSGKGLGAMPGMPGMPGQSGKHAGSNKKSKRKSNSPFKFPFGRS